MSDYEKKYHRDYYYKRRQEVYDYLGYQGCARCGGTENLEIDHIDPSLKSFNLSSNLSPRQPHVQDELNKCQLLCNSCHREKTAAENSGFTHGTVYAWMKKGCRCAPCSISWRDWHDKRNAERRDASSSKGRYGRPSECGEMLHYRRGCRCSQCRAANAQHARELKMRKESGCP